MCARPAYAAEGNTLSAFQAAQEHSLLRDYFPHPACPSLDCEIPGRIVVDGSGTLSLGQLTNRRMRTFITRPNAKNTNAVDDPP